MRSWALQVNLFVLMEAKEAWIPAADSGMDQVGADAEIDRCDRRLFEEQGLGLLEKLQSLPRVRGGGGPTDQFVVREAGPAGPVVAATGDQEDEERHRVDEIADSAGAGERVIEGLLVLQAGLL